jgi:hypothetical protein
VPVFSFAKIGKYLTQRAVSGIEGDTENKVPSTVPNVWNALNSCELLLSTQSSSQVA